MVTGSSSGIGEQIARRLSALGAQRRGQLGVVGRGRRGRVGRRCRASRSTCGPTSPIRTRARPCSTPPSTGSGGSTSSSTTRAGPPSSTTSDLDGLTDEIFHKTFDVNVFGTWWLTKAAIPLLRAVRRRQRGDHHLDRRCSSGRLVDRLRHDQGGPEPHDRAAGEVARSGPGERRRTRSRRDPVDSDRGGRCTRPWPPWPRSRRSATPDDCAEATLALLRNRYATGQVLVVDGGLTLVG